MKNRLESLTEELIQLRQSNKEQHKTLTRVNNMLKQLCSVNGQNQLYTAINNTYKRNKTDAYIIS